MDPTKRSRTPTASMRARSCTCSPSRLVYSTWMTLAGLDASASGTRPVATRPATVPAIVGSTKIGNALFVPVDSGMTGMSGQPSAAARLVPSPPSVTTTCAPASHSRRAVSVVSCSLCISLTSMVDTRSWLRVSVARRTRPCGSGSTCHSTSPTDAAPSMTRRMMLILSVSSDVPALATNRRMSCPECGLAISPTMGRSDGCSGVWEFATGAP